MKFYEDEIYVKMCEKAEEIQQPKRIWESGDFLIRKRANQICVVHGISGDHYKIMQIDDVWSSWNFGENTFTFLPRQDQLQEMIWDYIGSPLGIIEELDKNCNAITTQFVVDDYYKNFKSMEQLLLVYLMDQKFSKSWSGEEWV